MRDVPQSPEEHERARQETSGGVTGPGKPTDTQRSLEESDWTSLVDFELDVETDQDDTLDEDDHRIQTRYN